MEYKNESYLNKFKIEIKTLKFKSKANSNALKINSVSLSFPFNLGFNITFDNIEKEIAQKIIISLSNRRILNAFECCADCIIKSTDSLKEIKSDLINFEQQLVKHINNGLFYFVDSIISGINQYFNYIELNKIVMSRHHDNNKIYFECLTMLRNHITQCMYQISKIAEYDLNPHLFAIKETKEHWNKNNYLQNNNIQNINILV